MAWHYRVSYVTLALYIVQMKASGLQLALKYERIEMKNVTRDVWSSHRSHTSILTETFRGNEGKGTEVKWTCNRARSLIRV